MLQLARTTFHSASLRYLRWPYQAKVIKMLETASRTMVRKEPPDRNNASRRPSGDFAPYQGPRTLRYFHQLVGNTSRFQAGKTAAPRSMAHEWREFRSFAMRAAVRLPSDSHVEGERDEARWRGGNDGRHFRAVDRPVERVALDGDAAGSADKAFELGARSEFGSLGAGVMIDLFFDHGAVEVVCAKAQRDLRDARCEHDPISLDVFEVVEHEARNRN